MVCNIATFPDSAELLNFARGKNCNGVPFFFTSLNPLAAEFSQKMPFFTVKSVFLAVMTLNWR